MMNASYAYSDAPAFFTSPAAYLDPTNIARFEEQSTSPLGVDLEVQSTRVYPGGTLAAHVLGDGVPMQGSGTLTIESVIASVIPRDGQLLVLGNGAYGRRIAQIARITAISR